MLTTKYGHFRVAIFFFSVKIVIVCFFKTLIMKGKMINDCFSRNNWRWEDQLDATLS